jgi:hypothetical protein
VQAHSCSVRNRLKLDIIFLCLWNRQMFSTVAGTLDCPLVSLNPWLGCGLLIRGIQRNMVFFAAGVCGLWKLRDHICFQGQGCRSMTHLWGAIQMLKSWMMMCHACPSGGGDFKTREAGCDGWCLLIRKIFFLT